VSALGQWFHVIDLVGVSTNAVLGGIIAREERMDPIGFLTLASLSGLGGGTLRDITARRLPQIFGGNTLYATSAMVASALVCVFWYTGVRGGGVGATLAGAALCLVARYRGW
jgi:uncharacterized membrane protein YeiH